MSRAFTMALVLVLAFAASAAARTVKVADELGAAIPSATAVDVPVLLPATIDLDYASGKPIYGEPEDVKRGRYTLSLSAVRGCGEADACFLAEFSGKRGARLGYKATNVRLTLGQKGYYNPIRCGASCAPASIAWVQKGVRYEIQAKTTGGRSAFVKWANSAIRAGNRS
jgi:hypothetical protein